MKTTLSKTSLMLLMFVTMAACSQTTSRTSTSPSIPMNSNLHYSRTDTTRLEVSNDEWSRILPRDLYLVAREAHTERAFTGKYWDYEGLGEYSCAVCGNRLFKSDAKFASGCGWPSFFEPIRQQAVIYLPDNTHGMSRIEVKCGRCDSHLGHVFDDGPPPTYKRFCMNSISLNFDPESNTK
ncbi:MAG: peptide-methionine (R)-S-oxide reductase MsrB [Flavobacteriales bacterium]